MKIAVVSTPVFTCPPEGYSGLEALAWHTAKGLAEKGHKVTLIAPDGSHCPNCEMIFIGKAGSWDERRVFESYKGELHKFDVIVDHTWQKWSYTLKIDGNLKVPILGVCHAPINTMYQSLPAIDKPTFVCISKDQAAHFEALHGREARVCYNGVDLDYYKPLGIKRTDRFLFLARFSTIKGPDLAIDACIKADVGLDLVGDTSITQEPEFFEQCKKKADGVSGIPGHTMAKLFPSEEAWQKRIVIVGPAKRGECVYWYSQAHCLLHPNQRYREPFGLAPVEAMACSCPVIAWKYGALKETIGKEVGWLVQTFDDLVHAIECVAHPLSATGEKQRQYTREWASQFSIQKMIERYHELCVEAEATGGW